MDSPATTVSVLPDLNTDKSATVSTLVFNVVRLLPPTASSLAVATSASFVSVKGAEGQILYGDGVREVLLASYR